MLARVASTLNRNIVQSSRAQALAAQLEGRALALRLEGTSQSFYFVVNEGRIRIETEHAGAADATLAGKPLALLSLAGPDAEDRLRGSAIRIAGDAEVAQRFRTCCSQAQPDFEEELAARVRRHGRAPDGQFRARCLRLGSQGRRDSLATNVAEYLQEEGRDVPTRVELEEFLEAVDHLREAADRAEARLARLEARRRAT